MMEKGNLSLKKKHVFEQFFMNNLKTLNCMEKTVGNKNKAKKKFFL